RGAVGQRAAGGAGGAAADPRRGDRGQSLHRADAGLAPMTSLPERWSSWLIERNRRGMRFVLIITLALYPAFGVLDYLLAPRDALPILYGTRLLVAVTTLALFGVIQRPLFARHFNLISSTYILLAASGISVMTVFMGGLESSYYAGLSLVIVGTGLLFVWPMHVVLAVHVLILLSFLVPNLLLAH